MQEVIGSSPIFSTKHVPKGGCPQGYPPFPFAPYMAPCPHPGSARLLFWKTQALISEDPGSYFGRPRLLFRKRQALILEDPGSCFGRPRLLFRKTQALISEAPGSYFGRPRLLFVTESAVRGGSAKTCVAFSEGKSFFSPNMPELSLKTRNFADGGKNNRV